MREALKSSTLLKHFQKDIKATNLKLAREKKAELAAAAAAKQRLADARAKALRELQAKQKGAAQFESLAVMNAKADLGDAKREAAASKRALENTKGSFAPKSASLPDLASAKNRRNRNDLMKDHRERLKAKLRAAAPPIDEPEDTKESPTRPEPSGSRGRTPPPVPSRSRGSDGCALAVSNEILLVRTRSQIPFVNRLGEVLLLK